ncbi:cytochrome ubiquinol oxidase subunit I [Streptomyces javensis]|uniref:cytochrome ubiquinol oxidase subunit I n=1 Tax=Streptomyces javensis TaxID=114698 RepID=UPI0024842207|nr:cytochrome ubiquinol oxidase subunit I [Streptomyces javensis]
MGGLEIPYGLSLLVGFSPSTVIEGLNQAPPARRPPVTGTHLAFDLMVLGGLFLIGLEVWLRPPPIRAGRGAWPTSWSLSGTGGWPQGSRPCTTSA